MVPCVINPNLLMPSPKLPKTQIPYACWGEGEGGGGVVGLVSQLLTLNVKLLKTQIPYVHWGVGGGGSGTLTFHGKPKFPMYTGRGRDGVPTVDDESKTS